MSLAEGVIGFARLLRGAGVPVGTSDTLAALRALTLVEIGAPAEVEAALRCTLCRSAEHFPVFDQAFARIWREPDPSASFGTPDAVSHGVASAGLRRLAEAMATDRRGAHVQPSPQRREALHASSSERLSLRDFAAMGAEDMAQARRAAARLAIPRDCMRTRRKRPDPRGDAIDMAGTWRRLLRDGGLLGDFARSRPRRHLPPLVVLCDISGSMHPYAPMLLRFVHALGLRRRPVHVFLFGTRLTNVTRALAARDPEVAMQAVAAAAQDWSGGTRIAEALRTFNHRWGRRVLAQRASVLLFTDGLDRPGNGDSPVDLGAEMARLHRGCRTLIWVNPLLRWSGFAPRAGSIATMLPHVDFFRPAHNLASLGQLADLLSL